MTVGISPAEHDEFKQMVGFTHQNILQNTGQNRLMTDFSGFDEFADELDSLADEFGEMADNVDELEGENEVSFDDLFTEQFMQEHTDVTSFEGFISNSKWTVESEQDFEAIPEGEFDEYVRDHSDFNSWEDMYGAAGTEWVAREIGLR